MAGVTKEGVLITTGGGASSSTAIAQPVNATDAAVLNVPAVGSEYGVAVRLVGASGGGGPATIADGADVVEGSLADAAIITDTTGTINGKLRGLIKWAFERMPVSLGQKLMTASFPVVISSDQSAIPVSGNVSVNNFPASQVVTATNLDIRDLVFATDKVDVSGSSSVGVTGPLTDAQLRATAVPISGIISTKTDLTPSAPTATSIGVATTLAVAANANRKGLKLINTSNATISLGFGSPAVLNSGITLAPFGVFNMDEYDFDLGAVNAIASIAASNLAVQEYTT